jgi:hypothetical protein
MTSHSIKTSAMIEQLLVDGTYNNNDEYMCILLRDVFGSDESLKAARTIRNALLMISSSNFTLQGALTMRVKDFAYWSAEEQFAYKQQWYVWFVFDLKRQGK